MSILAIAWKSLRQRSLSSSLTALSVALGIMLMVTVLVIHGIISDAFSRKGTGYSLIIAAPGSELQTVMSCVYRLEMPKEPMPWRVYTEDVLQDPRVEWAVPMTMGDVTQEGSFPIVGTTPHYFVMEVEPGEKYRFRGKLMSSPFHAMIGSRVARDNDWDVGNKFSLVHGGADGHTHDEKFEVVGVLAPTGTADDKTVFVNIEGFFLMDEHDRPVEEAIKRLKDFDYEFTPEQEDELRAYSAAFEEAKAKAAEGGHAHVHMKLPLDLREVSFVLVRTKTLPSTIMLAAKFNDGLRAQAVNPIIPMKRFLDQFVGNVQVVLLFLTAMIVIVAGIGIFVSIYNSMSNRRREIAIMRALGAHRGTVFSIILGESLLLCVGGGIVGLILGHALVFASAPYIEAESGLLVNPWNFQPAELILFPVLMLMATLVGFLPGLTAYRTDVADSLTD